MKKYLISCGFLFLFSIWSLPVFAQNEVRINRPYSDQNTKTVAQARSIALTNTALSIGAGIASVAFIDNNTVQKAGAFLTVYGIVLAPSTGNFYVEDYPRGVIGMGARAVGTYLMVDATREVFGDTFANTFDVDTKKVSLTDTKMLVGEGLILAGLIYNLISLKSSVQEYNSNSQNFTLNVNSAVIDDNITPVLTASFNF